MHAIADWQLFFATVAGVSAAITGLVFVALSINLKEVLSGRGLTGRAGEAIILLIVPVLIGLLGIAPQPSITSVGYDFLTISILSSAVLFRILIVARRFIADGLSRWFGVRVLSAVFPVAFVLIGSIRLLQGKVGGFWLIAVGILLSIVSGLADAWVLLVEILR